jgi:hypothetical protein
MWRALFSGGSGSVHERITEDHDALDGTVERYVGIVLVVSEALGIRIRSVSHACPSKVRIRLSPPGSLGHIAVFPWGRPREGRGADQAQVHFCRDEPHDENGGVDRRRENDGSPINHLVSECEMFACALGEPSNCHPRVSRFQSASRQ